jgi:hypothetical protein
MRKVLAGAALMLPAVFLNQVAAVLGLEWGIGLAALAAAIGYGLLITSQPVRGIWVWAAAAGWRRKMGTVLLTGLVTGAAGSALAALFIWTSNRNAANAARERPVPALPGQQSPGRIPPGPASPEHAQAWIEQRNKTQVPAEPEAAAPATGKLGSEVSPREAVPSPQSANHPEKGKGREEVVMSSRTRVRDGNTVIQKGETNISQIGDNNHATVLSRMPLALNPGLRGDVLKAVAPFAGQKARIILNRSTDETRRLGNDLAQILKQAGIKIEHGGDPNSDTIEMMIVGPMNDGIEFGYSAQNLRFAEALGNALVNAGVVTPPIRASLLDHDVLVVWITPLR